MDIVRSMIGTLLGIWIIGSIITMVFVWKNWSVNRRETISVGCLILAIVLAFCTWPVLLGLDLGDN